MCKLGLVILISLLTGNNYAQDYFVLLQSDNRQPFYVRLGNQVYSSSSAGHLILSHLKDSTYTLAIGFPSQPGVEQTYALAAIHNDQELQIREHGEAGWGLFDSQTNGWLPMLSSTSHKEAFRAIGTRRDDAFSRLMAGVVRDTAVLYNDFAAAGLVTDSTAAATTIGGTNPAAAALVTPLTTPSRTRDSAFTTTNNIDSAATAFRPYDPHARPFDSTATAASRNADTAASGANSPGFKTDSSAARADTKSTATSSTAVTNSSAGTKPDSTVTSIKPDLLPANPKSDTTAAASVLHRPVSGSPGHKAPPAVDSSTRVPLAGSRPGISKLSQIRMTRNMRLVYALRDKEGDKADTVVVIIPLDSALAGSPKKANSDSARLIAGKPRSATGSKLQLGADSSRSSAIRSRSAADSARPATPKSRPSVDSSRTAATKSRPSADSSRTAATKSRLTAADSGRGKRGANPDTQSSVRDIIPTPISQPADKTHNDSAQKPKAAAKAPLPYINSDCHNFATDYDIDKLRVKMLEGAKEDDRINAALKVFKTKCFYTRQIRALSEVFTTDAAKYRFFETAYPFAADEHFRELATLLTDPVYANKFKTLTGMR